MEDHDVGAIAASAPSPRIACVMQFWPVRPKPRPYLTSSRALRKCRQRSEPLVRVSHSPTEIIRRGWRDGPRSRRANSHDDRADI